jgi:hypothetical protein
MKHIGLSFTLSSFPTCYICSCYTCNDVCYKCNALVTYVMRYLCNFYQSQHTALWHNKQREDEIVTRMTLRRYCDWICLYAWLNIWFLSFIVFLSFHYICNAVTFHMCHDTHVTMLCYSICDYFSKRLHELYPGLVRTGFVSTIIISIWV